MEVRREVDEKVSKNGVKQKKKGGGVWELRRGGACCCLWPDFFFLFLFTFCCNPSVSHFVLGHGDNRNTHLDANIHSGTHVYLHAHTWTHSRNI